MRITKKDLETKIERLNARLGLEGAEYGVDGMLVLNATSGRTWVAICRFGGESNLSAACSVSETYQFLVGLEAGLAIQQVKLNQIATDIEHFESHCVANESTDTEEVWNLLNHIKTEVAQ